MPNTTNFNWATPADTDLVKDGAAAIRTLGNSIDASLVDLKGGTTNQILAKNSDTDMDFKWVANDVGDITAVTAGTGLSGGGTSGDITLTNTVATTFDAKGDLVVGTGADTFAKLTVGTNGHTLVADSSTSTGLKWAAPAGGGKVLQVINGTHSTQVTITTSMNWTDTGLTASITPSSTNSKILVIVQQVGCGRAGTNNGAMELKLLRNSTDIITFENYFGYNGSNIEINGGTCGTAYLDSPSTTSAITYKTQFRRSPGSNGGSYAVQSASGTSTITLMEIGA